MTTIHISPEDQRFSEVLFEVDAQRVSDQHMTPSDAWSRDFSMKQSAEMTGIDEAKLTPMFRLLDEAFSDVCRAQEAEAEAADDHS